MRQKSGPEKQPAEDAIRDIRRATRRHFSAEEKIRIVLEGLRGEESTAELCRREGTPNVLRLGQSSGIPSARFDSTCWLGGGQQEMAKPYSQDLRDRVIEAVERGR